MLTTVRFAIGLVVILSFCVMLGCQTETGSQTARSSPPPVPVPPLAPNQTQPPQSAEPPTPEDFVPRTAAAEAISLARSGDALIIDVRGTDSFKIKHLKGAIDYPLDRIEKGDFSGLPPNRKIIAYCA